ncbi:hypothetical protein [Cyanobium sp. ULC084]|nr:MAG: hypothetical protein DCF24_10620 [Cyanobium sp.]
MASSRYSRSTRFSRYSTATLLNCSDACADRQLHRLGELIDQLLFDGQLSNPEIPMDPGMEVELPF